RRSLQFFDAHGDSIHKIFLQEETAAEAFSDLVAAHRAPEDAPFPDVKPLSPRATGTPDDAVDTAEFRAAWDALQDTHDFFPLLRRFGLGRTQALRLAGEPRARALKGDAARTLLEKAAAQEMPV